MTQRGPLDPELGDHFSVADARRTGSTSSRLRASDLHRSHRGSRSLGVPDGLADRCAAFLPVAPPNFAFSHATAAVLHGITLPQRLTGVPLDVSVPTSAPSHPRRRDVRSHRLVELVSRPLGGLPIVTAEEAWVQLAPLLTLDELVVAGDSLVRRKRPLTTVPDLVACVDARARARGIRRCRAALADVRPGTDSPPESWLRLAIVRVGLPEPVIGYTIYSDGAWVGTPDLAYPDHRIAIEYQGSGHWEDEDAVVSDIVRREMFHRAGWRVLEITKRRLRNPAHVAALVAELLAAPIPTHR